MDTCTTNKKSSILSKTDITVQLCREYHISSVARNIFAFFGRMFFVIATYVIIVVLQYYHKCFTNGILIVSKTNTTNQYNQYNQYNLYNQSTNTINTTIITRTTNTTNTTSTTSQPIQPL